MAHLSGEMIKTIFFDIGGVLINIHPEKTFQYLSDCTDISVEEIRDRFPVIAHDEYEKGNLTNTEWYLAVKDSLPQPCCLKEVDFWRAWKLLLGEEKETVKLLRKLRETYSIWLLSNTNPQHIRDEIEQRYTFPQLVHGTVDSFDVGLRKPDKEIYITAAQLADTCPKDSIFIDDLEENIHSAIKEGFTGIHFKTIEQLEIDLEMLGLFQKEKESL